MYFILPTDKLPLKTAGQLTNFGAILEQMRLKKGIYPEAIFNRREDIVFRVYKFPI